MGIQVEVAKNGYDFLSESIEDPSVKYAVRLKGLVDLGKQPGGEYKGEKQSDREQHMYIIEVIGKQYENKEGDETIFEDLYDEYNGEARPLKLNRWMPAKVGKTKDNATKRCLRAFNRRSENRSTGGFNPLDAIDRVAWMVVTENENKNAKYEFESMELVIQKTMRETEVDTLVFDFDDCEFISGDISMLTDFQLETIAKAVNIAGTATETLIDEEQQDRKDGKTPEKADKKPATRSAKVSNSTAKKPVVKKSAAKPAVKKAAVKRKPEPVEEQEEELEQVEVDEEALVETDAGYIEDEGAAIDDDDEEEALF